MVDRIPRVEKISLSIQPLLLGMTADKPVVKHNPLDVKSPKIKAAMMLCGVHPVELELVTKKDVVDANGHLVVPKDAAEFLGFAGERKTKRRLLPTATHPADRETLINLRTRIASAKREELIRKVRRLNSFLLHSERSPMLLKTQKLYLCFLTNRTTRIQQKDRNGDNIKSNTAISGPTFRNISKQRFKNWKHKRNLTKSID